MKEKARLFNIVMLFTVTFLLLSGCGGEDEEEGGKGKLMVLTSRVFERGESYKVYRGSKVRIRGTEAKYYAAPINEADEGSEKITFNLEFEEELSEDVPIVITKADEDSPLSN